MRLLTIIGTRPQVIKAAAFSRAVKEWNNNHSDEEHIHEVILHTGQHYDDNMSAVFFRELGMPEPDINLHVGSGSHGAQTARMIEEIEKVLNGEWREVNGESGEVKGEKEKVDGKLFDGVVLYGDTNSTLAGAVAASKLHVPVFHIEAGLRSWNMTMPEEINRIVCDNLSNILFTPTQTGLNNLIAEGFAPHNAVSSAIKAKTRFADGRGQYVILSGDVMYDNAMFFADMAEQQSDILERLGIEPHKYILATIHRPANTDSPANITSIFRALLTIAQRDGIRIVLPLHPRTRKLLPSQLPADLLRQVQSCPDIILTEPASFFDILRLERHARLVMTDSGGVQKEAFFFSTPCVILRPETEWVEIVNAGAGIIADADYNRIIEAYHDLSGREVHFPPLFGDAHAAMTILHAILAYDN